MGYETKLMIGKVCDFGNLDSGAKYFMVYATLDLCKAGYDTNIAKLEAHHKNAPLVYWYSSDGNTEEFEDCYGDKPIPLPIADVLEALRKDDKPDGYRRFKWAIALLESMKDDPEQLQVLLYGH